MTFLTNIHEQYSVVFNKKITCYIGLFLTSLINIQQFFMNFKSPYCVDLIKSEE